MHVVIVLASAELHWVRLVSIKRIVDGDNLSNTTGRRCSVVPLTCGMDDYRHPAISQGAARILVINHIRLIELFAVVGQGQ